MKKALVTGSSGFIGYFVSKKLLENGFEVVGVDDLNDYYDVELKKSRQEMLVTNFSSFGVYNEKIQKPEFLKGLFKENRFDIIVHLAAQAGVRYSIENPRTYLENNIIGTFEILEASRLYPPDF